MCACARLCPAIRLLRCCCRDRYGGLEQAWDPFQTPRELRKGVSAGPKCRISFSFCTPEGRTHARARPILLGGVEGLGGGDRAAKRTVDLPYSYHTFRARGGRGRRIFTCPISLLRLHVAAPARLPACLPACAAVGNPRGGAIKKNLCAFLSLPPFHSPSPFFHMKYRAYSHSFDIPANKAMVVQPRP